MDEDELIELCECAEQRSIWKILFLLWLFG